MLLYKLNIFKRIGKYCMQKLQKPVTVGIEIVAGSTLSLVQRYNCRPWAKNCLEKQFRGTSDPWEIDFLWFNT